MHRRRIFISLWLLALALLIAIAGGMFYSTPHELIVPIDRSVLDQMKVPESKPSPDAVDKTHKDIRSPALSLAPDSRFLEETQVGLLPRKAKNGDWPADFYARPFDQSQLNSTRPKLSIVILHSGISEALTAEAYLSLPPDVSFSVSPYAYDAERQIRDIRNRGHEVFLEVQSIAANFKQEDRGPFTLDPKKDGDIIRENLYWMMSRFTGYVGLIADLTPQAATHDGIKTLLHNEVKMRGLAYMQLVRPDSTTLTLQKLDGDDAKLRDMILFLPGQKPSALTETLTMIETRLMSDRKLIALIDPAPLSLEILKDWLGQHQSRMFDLMPLSAVIRHKEQI